MSRIGGLIGDLLRGLFRPTPVPPSEWRWAYRCYWLDLASGDELATSYHVVLTHSGTNYQQASSEARAEASRTPPLCVSRMQRGGRGISLRCQRVGQPVPLP